MVRLLSKLVLLHCHNRLFAVVFESKNLAVLGIALITHLPFFIIQGPLHVLYVVCTQAFEHLIN